MPEPSRGKVDRPHGRRLLAPRDGLWSAPPRPLRFSQRPVAKTASWTVLVSFAYLLIAAQLPATLALAGIVVWFFTAVVGLTLVSARMLNEARARRVTSADRAFSDAPPGLEEFPVELTLYDKTGAYGTDRGVVWFEDGILTFVGTACSFALAAEDLYPRWGSEVRHLQKDFPGDLIRLKIPNRAVALRLRPLLGPKMAAFRFRLGRFLVGGTASDRPRQWPPLEPYAEAETERGRPVRSRSADAPPAELPPLGH